MASRRKNLIQRKKKKSPMNGNNVVGIPRKVREPAHALGPAARKWAALLTDPCNGEVAHPCYGGTDSGYMIRVKYSFIINGNDGIVQWTPGAGPADIALQSGTNNTTGNPITLSSISGAAVNPFLTTNARAWRCAASCMKVRYTGAESTRAGLIGLKYTTKPTYVGGSGLSASALLATCPVVQRAGEVNHEIKWAPSETDSFFYTLDSLQTGGTLTLVASGTPGVSMYVELTTVYEWQPSGAQLAQVAQPPPSSNTSSDVLRYLGTSLKWLYGNVAAPVIRSYAAQGYGPRIGWHDEL